MKIMPHRCLSRERTDAFQSPTRLSQPNANQTHLPVSGSSLQLSRHVMTSSSHMSAKADRSLGKSCLQMRTQMQHQTAQDTLKALLTLRAMRPEPRLVDTDVCGTYP